MPHAYTEDPLVEQLALNRAVLETRGWVSFAMSSSAESDWREQLLVLATGLGIPAPTRSGGGLCDTLMPIEAHAAKPRSLSKIHSAGEFPLHADTAHWLTPCRYVMLACASSGGGNRRTLLLDTRRLPFSKHQTSLLHSVPLRVTNGRNSFFSTILSRTRPFVRFDPGWDGRDRAKCPACLASGFLGGTLWNEEVIDTEPGYSDYGPDGEEYGEPPSEIVEKTFTVEAFVCPVCGLHLYGTKEIVAAEVQEEFSTREAREREFEAEYGND